ncbi:unnamed protein product [Pieris macdunnoughi]|uniref:Gustatory receptor n=1 Tax=Pieris macdunnoughi TaxID=345717 RepID=A0A821NZR3_9NEOP|nr:unnamed protein product [Pieris macdunnoughi]
MINATIILWVTEASSSIIISIAASLNSYRRIGEFLEYMRAFDKASAKIKIPRDNGRIYKIIIIFVTLTRFLLDASYAYNLVVQFGIQELPFIFMSVTIKYFSICVLQMLIYISYIEVSLRIEYIKDELQDLVDNRLVCDDSTHSFYTHSVDEKVKNLHDLLDSIKTIYLKLNKHFETIFFFILLNILIRIILYFYGIASIIQNGFEENIRYWNHPSTWGAPVWYMGLYGIHNFITMFVIIHPFRVITCKLADIKLLMGRIMTMNNYAFRVFLNVNTFYEELISYNFSYTPLGIITIERSILIKVLAIGITCTAAILQFKK